MSVFNEKNLSSGVKNVLTILISILIVSAVVKAGTITPPSGGGEPSAKFYTISEIYTRLTTNAAATEASHDFTFSDSLAGTGRTLTEIYNAIPAIVANTVKLGTSYLGVAGTLVPSGGDAAPPDVLSGKTFFGGSQADWTLQTGVMANIGSQTITPSTSNSTITQGYHDGTGYCSGDADLIAGNIKSGANLFGIAGSLVTTPTYGDNSASQVLNTASNPGTYDVATCTSNYNTLNLSAGTVKSGIIFGDGLTGDYPSASYSLPNDTAATDATSVDIKTGLEAWSKAGVLITGSGTQILSSANDTVSAGYYNATTLSAVDSDLISDNILATKTIFGVAGNSNVVNTSSGDAIAGNILINKKAWVAGAEITGSAAAGANISGSNSSLLFTIPDGLYSGSKTCTASDTNLTVSNIKKGASVFGTTGAYSGYPGTVWTGTPAITQAACDAQNGSGWYWFEDGNGDGDTTDPEDGLCVKTTAGTAGSWNGDFFATQRDNSYIAAYTCSGSFPSGAVANYSGIDAAGAADTTFNNGDCALCQADCYDGQKDLPDQGGYTAPSEAITGNGGPITPEVLKNWKGTRLPTSNDFFGFCGATSGDIDSTAGDSAYHSSGASSSKTIGNYGGNAGRGVNSAPNDEYVDLSNSGSWEWLSEQHSNDLARIAGVGACSYFSFNSVYYSNRFRAVFRP